MGHAILRVFGLNFFLYLKKNKFCFRFFLNYIKFDDSYLMEQKIFYIFPPNNIL